MASALLGKLAKHGRTAAKRSDFTWRYVMNARPALSYRVHRPSLSGEAARVLDELNRNGVAVTSADALPGLDSYEELKVAVNQLERAWAERLQVLRKEGSGTLKRYLTSLLPENKPLNPDDVYTRFALQAPIVEIANAYYDMFVSLHYCSVWHTFVTQQPPSQSQLWHRDPEDRYILKVFVYLTDVDAGSGPFTYAKGTHLKRKLPRATAYIHKDGNTPRSTDAQMAEVVSPDQWLTCAGPKGTILFADTRGYHKGGLAREQERIVYVCEFFSQGAGRDGIATGFPDTHPQS